MVNASCSSQGALVRSLKKKQRAVAETSPLIGSMVAVTEPNLMIW